MKMIDLNRVWKRAFENIQDMKMDENEWKREDEVEIAEEVHTKRQLKHLRPPRRGLID